jgi:alpha-L-rhamnosidase
VDQIAELTGDAHLWNRGFQFGDWLDPTAPPEKPAQARTDSAIVATAYHARTAAIVAEAAQLLGLDDDHAKYSNLAAAVREAFVGEYVTPAGRMASDAQTAFALALQFDLLAPDEQRAGAGQRLQRLVRREGYRVGTGFVGTPLLCDALVDAGFVDDAYHLLLQTECPSWLYPVTMGATTIWERWDSLLPDGSINPGDMTSFNHYAFGAVGDFLHRRVAGLAPGAPGYATISVRPLAGGGLTYAEASLEMNGGVARVRWERDGERFSIRVDVPDGHDAVIEMPDGSARRRAEAGSHTFECQYRAAANDPPRPAAPGWPG